MDVQSFTINHDDLFRGIYVSRKDYIGKECLTTFDIRMKEPNKEPVLDNPVIHTMEHLMAVYIRSEQSGWSDELIYIGPMGCRTGFYMIVKGEKTPEDVLEILQNTYKFIIDFKGIVPATTSRECGNYLDHNLDIAKWEAAKFFKEVLMVMRQENMIYPK